MAIKDHALTCEHTDCNDTISIDNAHSCLVVLQKVEPDGYSFHQCEQGQEFRFVNWQHFHCSHEHMKVVVSDCITSHYSESDLSGRKFTRFGKFHKIVMGSGLLCKVCQKPLTDVAYRFCLTMATPVNHIPDDSMNELGEWCCSLEHAKESALFIVSNILPV
jgi:hypothetical protein